MTTPSSGSAAAGWSYSFPAKPFGAEELVDAIGRLPRLPDHEGAGAPLS